VLIFAILKRGRVEISVAHPPKRLTPAS
jgi:hypothetical protein